MIRSFADSETESLFFNGKSRKYGSIADVARRKLQVLDDDTTIFGSRPATGLSS
jgi:plasmid maintenance system killer protein